MNSMNTYKINGITNLPLSDLEDLRCSIDKEIATRREENYKKLYSAFDVIIESTQNIKTDAINYLNVHSYYREMRTVQINPGRLKGKTSYIASRFDKVHDIVICLNMDLRKRFIEVITNNGLMEDLRCESLPPSSVSGRIFSKHRFDIQNIEWSDFTSLRSSTIKRVWIDECGYGLPLNINMVYNLVQPVASKEIVFIKMGE